MKLRQKLAVVLASAMVVSAVPVVTMADSTNKIVRSVQVIEKDDKTTGVALRMEFEDADGEEEEFYFTLTNAKWLKPDASAEAGEDEDKDIIEGLGNIKVDKDKVWTLTPDGKVYKTDKTAVAKVTYTRQSDTVMKINVPKGLKAKDVINFTLPIKATGGAVSVAVTGEGSTSSITEGSYKLISTGEDAASLTVGTANAFYQDGEIAPITLKETFLGSFGSDNMVLKISLHDTDFEFVESSKVTIEGSYGFNFGKKNVEDDSTVVKFDIDEEDESVAYIWLSKSLAADAKSQGRIKITGLEVSSDEKDLTEGNLLADITTVDLVESDDLKGDVTLKGGASLDKDYDDQVVATIANYGINITMKDSKAVDIVAGREEEIEFTVAETVDDVFVTGRTMTLSLKDNEEKTDKQFFMIPRTVVEKSATNRVSDIVDGDDDSEKIIDKVEFTYENDDDLDKEKNNIYYQEGMVRVNEIKVTFKDNPDDDGDSLNKNDEVDKFKVKTKIYVPVDQQDKKSVEIVGEFRSEDVKGTTAVNIIDPFDVTFTQTTLKVGLQDQTMGNITLTEKDKEMLMKGEVIFDIVDGSKDDDGIVIEEKGDLTVSGDLKKTDFGTSGDKADKVTLKRQSKAASSLSIDNMVVTVDRTVPEGYYDLELSGDAIDEYDGTYSVEDYIVIGTPNTQDITSAGLTKGTVTFVIGESKYAVNGIETQMDAPSYIQDPGYTMVPVRFVAQAFGVAEKDILFGNGSVTIFAGERTLNLTNGSAVAVVNGNSVQMGTAVVIKDGRTYVPAGEIARLLGIATSWDAATKTATFTN